jgi:hypothetical protein
MKTQITARHKKMATVTEKEQEHLESKTKNSALVISDDRKQNYEDHSSQY